LFDCSGYNEQQIGILDHVDWDLSFVGNIQIHHSWLNVLNYDGRQNGFEWHNESDLNDNDIKYDGSHVCILWLTGDVDRGGNLLVNDDNGITEYKFQPGHGLIIKKDNLHKVLHYDGSTTRRSLNFMFDWI